MPRLTKVVVWPTTGKPTKPWEDLAEADSFIRTARRVSEAFREALEREQVEARHRAIELFLDAETVDDTIAVRVVEHGVTDGAESGSITVSTGFHTLDPYTRAFYVADALQAAARRLGERHGWDLAAIDRAMDRVRENDYDFDWSSDAVLSPDGSTAVRLRAELDDDGFGRVRFVFTRAGDREPYLVTDAAVLGTRRGDFRKIARSLLWEVSGSVSARLGSRALVIDPATGEVEVTPSPVSPRPNSAPADPSLPLPRLVVEDAPPIAFTIGGGPTSKAARAYIDEIDRLFGHIATELDWLAWWLHASIPVIELEYWLESKRVKTTVLVAGEVLSATISRPRKSVHQGDDGVAMARVDVISLLADIRLHTGLGEHPPLPF